jgi:hypothetical protein
MHVNEQMITIEKKALNELRALTIRAYTSITKKRKTIIGFPCRSQRNHTCPKKKKRCEVADGICSNLQIAQFTRMISGLISIPTTDR